MPVLDATRPKRPLSAEATLRALSYLIDSHNDSGTSLHVPRSWPWFRTGSPGAPRVSTGILQDLRARATALDRTSDDPLGDEYQRLLAAAGPTRTSARRRAGAFYTPPDIVARLVRLALKPLLDHAEHEGGREAILALRILDPACGSARFLIAAAATIAERIGCTRAQAASCVYGLDLDPIAAELARYTLARWTGCHCSPAAGGHSSARPPQVSHIHAADALLAPLPKGWPSHFHAILGNPPFLNQLESRTTRSRANHAALTARYGAHLRPYTDTSALFLLRALDLAAPEGSARIALIQPTSILSARDAEPIRRALHERATLDALWTAGEHVFAAGVHVCAPILTVTTVGQASRLLPSPKATATPVARFHGPNFLQRQEESAPDSASGSWAPLIADTSGLPTFSIRANGTVADLATATADFRDQFYGLRGCIVEDSTLTPAQRDTFPRLITSGLIDPLDTLWSRRPCRLLGRLWHAPRADPAALERAGLGPWSRQRLVPKLLLATQTRTLEVIIDERGDLLPVTPVITITPRDPARLHHLAAALLSPILTAHALRHHAGAALSPSAIKLSAKQVLALPLPEACPEWDEAAALLSGCHCSPSSAQQCETTPHDSALLRGQSAASSGTQARLLATAELMCNAYAVTEPSPRALLAWWSARLAPRRPYKSPL